MTWLADPETGEPLGAVPTFAMRTPEEDERAGMQCPRCGAAHWQHRCWTPDFRPTRYHRQCFVCGWQRTEAVAR